MKILISDYAIDVETGALTLYIDDTNPDIRIESLLLITRMTANQTAEILWNFATSNRTYEIDGNTIYFPWIMNLQPAENLQIYYDYVEIDNYYKSNNRYLSTIKNNSITSNYNEATMKALLTTLTDLTDSMYNVAEKLRILDAVRDNAANIRVQPTGGSIGSIAQLSGIIGDFTSTSTTAGYLRVGALTSQHNSAAQININNIIP